MYSDNVDDIFNDILDKSYLTIKSFKKSITRDDVIKFSNTIKKSIVIEKYKKIENEIINSFDQYILYHILSFLSTKQNDFINFLQSFEQNAKFNSIILRTKSIIENIIYINKNIQHIKDGTIVLDESYKETMDIFNSLNESITSNIKSDDTLHNVIKYILYTIVFIPNDKSHIFSIIEEFELESRESRMIEIMEAINSEVNYVTLEKILNEYDNVFIDDIYNMLISPPEEELTLEDKINYIFKRKILIPITDEMLRYNKSTELYDQNTNIDPNVRSNKKNNTKIKYIINKMNDAMDYYRTNNTKPFYQPLMYRKAILINNLEELDILKKLSMVHNKTDDQIGQIEELTLIRRYPYQNFRDFKDYGFQFEPNSTVRAIRYSNIESLESGKYDFIKSSLVDWRIINKDIMGHIVGLMIPVATPDIGVNKYGEMMLDISERIHTMPYTTFSSQINSLTPIDEMKRGTINSLIYTTKKMIMGNSFNKKAMYWIFNKEKDQMKKFIEVNNIPQDEYYKLILGYIYDELSDVTYEKVLNNLSVSEATSLYDLLHIASDTIKLYLPLTQSKQNMVHNYILNSKMPKFEDKYDISDDYIPGLNNELIPLKVLNKNENKNKIIKVVTITDEVEEDFYHDATCQHVITWERMKQLRASHPNRFNDRLNVFMKEFVIENLEKEFICKSCSEIVPIKKYLADWTSSTEEGITITLSLQTTLENIAEYEKYSVAIKNMSKIIEKMASSVGLTYMTGPKLNADIKRQEIIKILIDLIGLQNEKMKETNVEDRKRRLEESSKKYGISPNLTQFFLFELKNELFTFSSKDVDKFKKPKINNIISYMIILLLNEINNGIIKGFANDKVLNYYAFEKIGFSLFNGIYIRINTANDITLITKYKLLCYVIFILSGIVVKYNMWFGESQNKKVILSGNDQKSVIHTCIDLLNNILDSGGTENKKYIYEFYSKKFFQTLREVYSGSSANETLSYLKDSIDKKITVISGNKIVFKTNADKDILLKPYFDQDDFGVKQYNLVYGQILNKVAYKKTVSPNDFVNFKKGDKESTPKKIYLDKDKKYKEYPKINDRSDDFYEHIENTIKLWESVIGVDTKINGENMYLRKTVYTINHDYRGNKLDSPIILTDSDKNLVFKKNDPHFNINVYLFYSKENDVYMFYNAQNYNYVGYKSGNNYVDMVGTNCNLMPRLSIKHKLLFLCHSNMFYEYDSDISDNNLSLDNNKILRFITNIIRDRILNLKNCFVNIQRIINQLFFMDKRVKGRNYEPISLKFDKKIKNPITSSGNYKLFDKINEVINSSFIEPIDKNITITFDKSYVYSGNLVKIFNTDQKMIMYICDEFNKLLEINTNEHNKIILVYLFVNIIDQEYSNFNSREYSNNFADVKKFSVMESNFYNRVDVLEVDIFDGLTDEEKKEKINQMKDEEEANNALDIDLEDDEDGDGNTQVYETFSENR